MRGNLNNHPFPVDFGLAGRGPWVGAEASCEENHQLGKNNWFISDRNDRAGNIGLISVIRLDQESHSPGREK